MSDAFEFPPPPSGVAASAEGAERARPIPAAEFAVPRSSESNASFRARDAGCVSPVSEVAGAADVVREVIELTHEFRSRERGSVEVRFALGDRTEVAVRLACRDGMVHATFRTDSDELRDALSRDWSGLESGPGGFHRAEAVFTRASGSFPGTADQEAAGFADRDPRRQSPGSPAQPVAHGGTRSRDRGGAEVPASPALPSFSPRPSLTRLLHAFA